MYKILVADDEKDVVSLLKDYFEVNDYLVITAYTGAEAMEKCFSALPWLGSSFITGN